MAIGSIIAQLITIFVSPISTRLYTPEQLGVYTLTLTFASLFGPVICGRYDLAIVTASNDDEAHDLVIGSVLVTFIFTAMVGILYSVYLFYNQDVILELGIISYVVLPILLFTGFLNVLVSLNNRSGDYRKISTINIIRTLYHNIGLILFGVFGFGSSGLIVSRLIGEIGGVSAQKEKIIKLFSQKSRIYKKSVYIALNKYKNQVLFSTPAQLVNTASYTILNFFITDLFGLAVFGYYSITYRILGLPLTIVSTNISKVFFQNAVKDYQYKRDFRKVLLQNTLVLLIIAIPMVVILMFAGPFLFNLIFGNEWSSSGNYARILAPMYGFRLIVSSFTSALIITNRQNIELLLQGLFLIIGFIVYITIRLSGANIESFLILISIGYSIVYLIIYMYIYKISKIKENRT